MYVRYQFGFAEPTAPLDIQETWPLLSSMEVSVNPDRNLPSNMLAKFPPLLS